MKFVRIGAPLEMKRRRIVQTFAHPNFNENTNQNNIALFKLDVIEQ
jgi:hypothetical protein